jgi:hypothetical protein
MTNKLHILALALIGGCVSTSPIIPPRYQVGIPSADAATNDPVAGTVYLGRVFKSYTIPIVAITNNANIDPESPAYLDIATNRWPARRTHVDLSLDGGATWPHRIGYGVQFDAARIEANLVWSPPDDYSLMTTNARLRAVPLDGSPWPQRTPPAPYDIPPGSYPMSGRFSIVGAVIDEPAGGILWRGNSATLRWRQLGGGTVYDLYWLTPDSAAIDMVHWVTSISNVVDGVNTKVISLNVPAAPQVRLALVSASDQWIIGYSQTFTVDP